MSLAVERAQVRKEIFDTETQDLNATTPTNFNRAFQVPQNTRKIDIDFTIISITGGTPTSWLNTAIRNLEVKFNGEYFIDNYDGLLVEKFIENPYFKETKEYSLEGLTVTMLLEIPIPQGTRVSISCQLGTINECIGGTPTTVKVRGRIYLTDGNLNKNKGKMYRHLRKTSIDALAINEAKFSDLGNFARLEKTIYLRVTSSGTLTDGLIREVELLSNGNSVYEASAMVMKNNYRKLTDNEQAGVGYYALKFPLGGFRADNSSQLQLKVMPKATDANAKVEIFEVYQTGLTS